MLSFMSLRTFLTDFLRPSQFDVSHRENVAVRMEAIGGQGANSAGKVLAEAAVLGMGFTGNHFSSFGSEKRGTPVRSFVRFSTVGKEIRSASSIRHPDLLIIFHDSLLRTHPELFEGVSNTTDLLVNSAEASSAFQFPHATCPRSISVVDALKISSTHGGGINGVLLGAAARLLPEIPIEQLEASFNSFFKNLPPSELEKNRTCFRLGFEKVRRYKIDESQLVETTPPVALPQMGYINAPIGGWIVNPGNSVLKDNSASRRGVLPKLDRELCFHCGYCDMVCPDLCFVWDKDGSGKAILKGIDYQYCKGCQKCVVACPVNALTPVAEDKVGKEDREVKLFPTATAAATEKKWKTADWSAQIAELSPEQRMMTLQTELLDPNSYLKPEFPDLKGKLK
ncbi:MAG: 2-oxoacid:acceptor oxidoreductase family protein [Bdellovibrionales bacterium]|nr:2-oxoacid:acceptor oxidoreductase family protein [Bdellovibrionales bacterium]